MKKPFVSEVRDMKKNNRKGFFEALRLLRKQRWSEAMRGTGGWTPKTWKEINGKV